jgi:hypothetical protein
MFIAYLLTKFVGVFVDFRAPLQQRQIKSARDSRGAFGVTNTRITYKTALS